MSCERPRSTRSPSRSSAAPCPPSRRRWARRWCGPATPPTSRSGGTAPPRCSTRAGDTLCQAEHIPMHLGCFIGIIPHILKRHPVADMQPGDVFVGNDAYEGGGTHLPDIVLAEPIFVDGMLWPGRSTLAHHADFADRGHAHIYQEGLRIPPIRLYRAGVLQADVQELILLNCQVPRERLSDLRAQMAANRLGVDRMRRFAPNTAATPCWPPGTRCWTMPSGRCAPASPPSPTAATISPTASTTRSSTASIAVSCTHHGGGRRDAPAFEAPDQVRAGLNMAYTALLSTVYYAVKTVVDPTVLPNAGLARPLHVTARPGSIVNCVHPAAVNGRIGAVPARGGPDPRRLAPGLPDRVIAACNGACVGRQLRRHQPDGSIWVYLETIGGGSGARADQGRAGRRARPHDQHQQPAGRGAGDRVSADRAALRAGGRLRRRRAAARRHGLRRVYRAERRAACGSPARARCPPRGAWPAGGRAARAASATATAWRRSSTGPACCRPARRSRS